MAAELRAYRALQLQERLLAGPDWEDSHDLVFTTALGRPLYGTDVTKTFQRLTTRAGLRRMRFHDLRHGYASLLLVEGIPPRVVMEMLGHSTIALTMNTYSHVIPDLTRDAAQGIDRVLAV